MHDYIFETELKTNTSMRPIRQVCLDMEHVYLAMAYRLAKKYCEPRDISAFVTDALVCHPSAAQRKKLEAAATAVRHGDGSCMFRIKQSRGCVVCMTEPPVTAAFELASEPPQWQDFFETNDQPAFNEAGRLVMEGRSVFLQGFGGTGRTCAAKMIVKELLEGGKTFAVQLTHTWPPTT